MILIHDYHISLLKIIIILFGLCAKLLVIPFNLVMALNCIRESYLWCGVPGPGTQPDPGRELTQQGHT